MSKTTEIKVQGTIIKVNDFKGLAAKADALDSAGESEAAQAVRELLYIADFYGNQGIDEHTLTLAQALLDAHCQIADLKPGYGDK